MGLHLIKQTAAQLVETRRPTRRCACCSRCPGAGELGAFAVIALEERVGALGWTLSAETARAAHHTGCY